MSTEREILSVEYDTEMWTKPESLLDSEREVSKTEITIKFKDEDGEEKISKDTLHSGESMFWSCSENTEKAIENRIDTVKRYGF
jgi:hypothetical protein